MKVKLKKLKNQTIVITGASSGIGLTTARMASERGARLVVAARNEEGLRRLEMEIKRKGGKAIAVVADVGREEDVREIARRARETFGGFDTRINNAGVSVYGRMLDITTEDHRRLFETNFWGVVYGSLEAARYLKESSSIGGAIINVGSTVSDRAVPIQGMYSASKHAVKGFTDALRMELERDGAPISVTLIKPGAINTPYPQHAKNYMDVEPTLPAPVYAPEVVAEAILYAAETPVRDLFAGGGGKVTSAMGQYAPRLTDKVMKGGFADQQKSDRPAERRHDGLHEPSPITFRERGNYEGHVAESSVYTKATMRPIVTSALIVGTGLLIAQLVRGASAQETGGDAPINPS